MVNSVLHPSFGSAPVAQLDRAAGFEPVGREFESLRAHQKSVAATPPPAGRSRAVLSPPVSSVPVLRGLLLSAFPAILDLT
jgi:hypothetical protein